MNTEFKPMSKEQKQIVKSMNVQINGGSLVQYPFAHLNPSDYPQS